MKTRTIIYPLLDLCFSAGVALAAFWASSALPAGWGMTVRMILGMGIGMLLGHTMGLVFSIGIGMFEAMYLGSLSGAFAGMIGAMTEPGMSLSIRAVCGMFFGAAAWMSLAALNSAYKNGSAES